MHSSGFLFIGHLIRFKGIELMNRNYQRFLSEMEYLEMECLEKISRLHGLLCANFCCIKAVIKALFLFSVK